MSKCHCCATSEVSIAHPSHMTRNPGVWSFEKKSAESCASTHAHLFSNHWTDENVWPESFKAQHISDSEERPPFSSTCKALGVFDSTIAFPPLSCWGRSGANQSRARPDEDEQSRVDNLNEAVHSYTCNHRGTRHPQMECSAGTTSFGPPRIKPDLGFV